MLGKLSAFNNVPYIIFKVPSIFYKVSSIFYEVPSIFYEVSSMRSLTYFHCFLFMWTCASSPCRVLKKSVTIFSKYSPSQLLLSPQDRLRQKLRLRQKGSSSRVKVLLRVSASVWVPLCECLCVSASVWVPLCGCLCVGASVWVPLCRCLCVSASHKGVITDIRSKEISGV